MKNKGKTEKGSIKTNIIVGIVLILASLSILIFLEFNVLYNSVGNVIEEDGQLKPKFFMGIAILIGVIIFLIVSDTIINKIRRAKIK